MDNAEAGWRMRLLDSVEPGLKNVLEATYGSRLEKVVEALGSISERYYFRNNTLPTDGSLVEEMRTVGIQATLDERVEGACFLATRESTVLAKGHTVRADKFAAEAVLQGSHLYAPGVTDCRGLRLGSEASVVDGDETVVGSGFARQGETSILTYRQGIAVEVVEGRFGLPSLRETKWFDDGRIYLQSLPAMVTCKVLDPRPGETIVDLNCAPGGKLSYMCQLTGSNCRMMGFDRNERKIGRTRRVLERLHCKNYQLHSRDSRYVHVDYSLRPDKVLVDPPCTGLGVTPKLSVETTGADVGSLSNYQKQFLTAASCLVRPGGVIVYSVCTVTRNECEEVARFGVEELGLTLEEQVPMLGVPGMDPEGVTQRFDPDTHGLGYFIARFRKN